MSMLRYLHPLSTSSAQSFPQKSFRLWSWSTGLVSMAHDRMPQTTRLALIFPFDQVGSTIHKWMTCLDLAKGTADGIQSFRNYLSLSTVGPRSLTIRAI